MLPILRKNNSSQNLSPSFPLSRAQELPPLSFSPNQPTNQLSVNDISFPNFPLWRISTAEGKCAAVDAATESRPKSLELNQFYLFIHKHSMNDHNRQTILGIACYVDLINPILYALGGLKYLHLLRVFDPS